MQGENGPLCLPSWKVITAKGLSWNNLCVLCLLFGHPVVFNPGGSKGKEELISIEGNAFLIFAQHKLCDLCITMLQILGILASIL